jgi:hypothetical protein
VDWLNDALRDNYYPGRGVLWCRTGDGTLFGAYFLTGRSPASQARTLRRTVGGDLIVAPSGAREHDHLRHYIAARQSGDWMVFGNGEQVSTVADRLTSGAGSGPGPGRAGLRTRPADLHSPPDGDRGQPRGRSGLVRRRRAQRREPHNHQPAHLHVSDLAPGEGVLMTTYHSDGQGIVTGTPFMEVRTTAGNRTDLLDELWSALPPNSVSLRRPSCPEGSRVPTSGKHQRPAPDVCPAPSPMARRQSLNEIRFRNEVRRGAEPKGPSVRRRRRGRAASGART